MSTLNGFILVFYFFSSSIVLARVLPPGDVSQLGTPCKSHHNELLVNRCINSNVTNLVTGTSTLDYTSQGSFEDLRRFLSGGMSASVDIPLIGGAEGSISIANLHAAGKNSVAWNYMFASQAMSQNFVPDQLLITQVASQRLLSDGVPKPELVYQECGDEYVSQIDYGASLIATFKIDFLRTQDKFDFEGKLRAEFNAVFVTAKGTGDLNVTNNAIGEASKVRVVATQIGGDQAQLAKILSSDVSECTLENLSKCIETLKGILKYAGEDFAKQFDAGKKYSILRYHTTPYVKATHVKHLVENANDIPINPLVVLKRRELERERDHLYQVTARASDLLGRWSSMLKKDGLAQKITDIHDKAYFRLTQVTERLNICFREPFNCIAETENHQKLLGMIAAKEIDESVLDLTGSAATPHEQLCDAVRKGSAVEIRQAGPKACAPLFNGTLPLHLAVIYKQPAAIKELLQNDGCSKDKINEPDALMMTPLCLAITSGVDEIFWALIDAPGIDLEKKCYVDNDDLTLLQIAASLGFNVMVDSLLDKECGQKCSQ